MLIVPKVNRNVTVTLNIGLGDSIAWGKYKKSNAEHGAVKTLVDILDTPYRIARVLERVKQLTYNPKDQRDYALCSPIGIHDDFSADIKWRTVQSHDEMTLVVKFEAEARFIIGQVFSLAEELKQDCIAVWIHNDVNGGIGQLIGRYNYVWSGGYFNPEYFIQLNDGV